MNNKRKHKGINPVTGKLLIGFQYTGERTSSGLPKIKKVLQQKGGAGGKKNKKNALTRFAERLSLSLPRSQPRRKAKTKANEKRELIALAKKQVKQERERKKEVKEQFIKDMNTISERLKKFHL